MFFGNWIVCITVECCEYTKKSANFTLTYPDFIPEIMNKKNMKIKLYIYFQSVELR